MTERKFSLLRLCSGLGVNAIAPTPHIPEVGSSSTDVALAAPQRRGMHNDHPIDGPDASIGH